MTTPDGQGLPQPRTGPPPFGQSAVGNSGPTVQVGGSNIGNINITGRPKLPVIAIARGDREAALEPLWAHTPTPQQAANLLAAHGLAVIVGERGTGRRISAVRALHTHLSTPAEAPQLYDLAADWEDDEVPEREVLPEPIAGHGYLIDAASRLMSENAARALTAWAEELHAVGSCLVITGSSGTGAGGTAASRSARYALTQSRSHAITSLMQAATHRRGGGCKQISSVLRHAACYANPPPTGPRAFCPTSSRAPSAPVTRSRSPDVCATSTPDRLARAAEHKERPLDSPEYQQGGSGSCGASGRRSCCGPISLRRSSPARVPVARTG
ncbi:hypothetical protein GTV15_20660 [Streptomyces sp. SID7803]|nr:hypothetical protein [Streptomyces sp. SID7803]